MDTPEMSFSRPQVDFIKIDNRFGLSTAIIPSALFVSMLILFPSSSLLMAQDSNYTNTYDLHRSEDYDTTRISNQSSATTIVAYNNELGFIQEKRSINNLSLGLNLVRFENIAPSIEPTSAYLNFSDNYKNCCTVEEQIFEYDILNLQAILQKLVGKEITVYIGISLETESDQDNKSSNNNNNYASLSLAFSENSFDNNTSPLLSPITGKLLAFEQNNIIILDTKEGQIKIIPAETIKLISSPSSILSEFVIRPSLVWKIQYDNEVNTSMSAASHNNIEAVLSYLTRGINWNADYIAVLDKNDSNLSIQGWITLDNQAGTDFRNFTLKLIAGDVNLESVELYPSQNRYDEESAGMALPTPSGAEEDQPAVSERQFFDYHLYSVNGTIDEINDNQTKQLKLFESENIGIDKTYMYDISADILGVEDTIPVSISLSFNNTK